MARSFAPLSAAALGAAILLPLALRAQTPTPSAPPPAQSPATLTLMPVPSSLALHDGRLTIDSTFRVAIVGHTDPRLERAVGRFITRMARRTDLNLPHGIVHSADSAQLVIHAVGPGERVQGIDEDESYTLESSPKMVMLHAPTTVGVIRGLETTLQLIDGDSKTMFIPSVSIQDTPRFRWRGFHLDVSRHFEPVDVVKRELDAMAAVKLNVFHWHLSDDQGFRVESKRFPLLQKKGSDGLYYTQAQIRDIVAYARDRGIRVVPEFDMPGHATSWLVAYPYLASDPGKLDSLRRGWSGYGETFDPTRESTYRFIDQFIGEMTGLFPDAYWHVGGDEVGLKIWPQNPRVKKWMDAHGFKDTPALQTYFNQRLSKILTKHHRNMIGWDEILHPDLPSATVIESWRGTKYLGDAADAGYQGILAAPFYLDHIETAAWVYLHDPLAVNDTTMLTGKQAAGVLGGESAMWSEFISPETLDSRVWPRTAAIAERFWSPQSVRDVPDMYRRLRVESMRLESLGLRHETNVDRMLRSTVLDPSWQTLLPLFDAVEPTTLGQRIHARRTVQSTPLVQIADIARPDPWLRWTIKQYAESVIAGQDANGVASDSLRALFTEWQKLPAAVQAVGARSPVIAQGGWRAAQSLAAAGTIGLAALDARASGKPLTQSWIDQANVTLTAIDKPQGLLHLVVVPAVREILTGTPVPEKH
jgi:hexosaminidase